MSLIIAGTGTDVGKTILSTLIMAKYGASHSLYYLKPVQTGADSDRDSVATLSGLERDHFLAQFIHLSLPASPHYATEVEGREIKYAELVDYISQALEKHNLVVELAGGLMVPLVRYRTNLDLLRDLAQRVILVARTELGTINHTVLSVMALQNAGVACAGVFFVGAHNILFADNCRSISEMTGLPVLGAFFLPEQKMTAADFSVHLHDFDAEEKILSLL